MSISSTFYSYFVEGIIQANIISDGGQECFAEIPPIYHYFSGYGISIMSLIFYYAWSDTLYHKQRKIRQMCPNLYEKVIFLLGVICLVLIMYFKIKTRKGLFILNPCHILLLVNLYLLIAEDNSSPFNRKLHTASTAWLFGAILALFIPHLEGVLNIEIFTFYYEHLLLFPVGPVLLYRRYGIVRPNLKNQLASFTTICIYQASVLMTIGRFTKVNLNYSLCHSPADPSYALFGYHYFTFQAFLLNLISLIIRWIVYHFVRGIFRQKQIGLELIESEQKKTK